MGKFDRYSETVQKERPWKIHPIWRGIGCLMMILIPVVSYAAADVLLTNASSLGINFPRDMYRPFMVSSFEMPFTLGEGVLTVGFMVAFFGAFTIIYSLVYRTAGPPRYGPTDVPPMRRPKKRRR